MAQWESLKQWSALEEASGGEALVAVGVDGS